MASMANISLPQPPDNQQYKYVPYDIFETDWLGDHRRLIQSNSDDNDDDTTKTPSRYEPGTLVWVLLSKGKPKQPTNSNNTQGYNALALHKKRRNKKNKRKNNNNECIIDEEADNAGQERNDKEDSSKQLGENEETISTLNHSRKEFFIRARVISDDEEIISSESTKAKARDERRILVRYSKGATYRVRAYNLIPVLEPCVHNVVDIDDDDSNNKDSSDEKVSALPPLVVIVPETNIYRRVAKIHTTPDDSFMEIGCDYGITCDKIYNSLVDAGDVPKVWSVVDEKKNDGQALNNRKLNGDSGSSSDRVSCLGIDKSKVSIDIANERYPKCKFALGDVLIPNEMSGIRILCETSLIGSAPSIICIDVNGNREIEGVLECVSSVMNEKWKRLPRMIIVKSRYLYWELKKNDDAT